MKNKVFIIVNGNKPQRCIYCKKIIGNRGRQSIDGKCTNCRIKEKNKLEVIKNGHRGFFQ